MNQITIPKQEYVELKKHARAYQNLIGKIFESAIKDPVGNVVNDFRKTDLYSKEFLIDLETGLRKSSYVKRL